MEILHFQELNSSQQKARELLTDNLLPYIVLTDKQSQGKGTKGRSWQSPVGGLYFTLALELDFNVLKINTESYAEKICLVVVEELKQYLQEYFSDYDLSDLVVKPINDLYYNDAKLAGVLLETINNRENSILLVGIGLNIKPLELELDRKVISLEEILAKEMDDFDKEDFLKGFAKPLSEAILMVKNSSILN